MSRRSWLALSCEQEPDLSNILCNAEVFQSTFVNTFTCWPSFVIRNSVKPLVCISSTMVFISGRQNPCSVSVPGLVAPVRVGGGLSTRSCLLAHTKQTLPVSESLPHAGHVRPLAISRRHFEHTRQAVPNAKQPLQTKSACSSCMCNLPCLECRPRTGAANT